MPSGGVDAVCVLMGSEEIGAAERMLTLTACLSPAMHGTQCFSAFQVSSPKFSHQPEDMRLIPLDRKTEVQRKCRTCPRSRAGMCWGWNLNPNLSVSQGPLPSAFSWQNSISLWPASFCTPMPNSPVTPVFLDFLLLHSSPL